MSDEYDTTDSPDLEQYVLKGQLCSTRPLPGREVCFSREALQLAADQFIAAGAQLYRDHRTQRMGRVTRVWLEDTADGATEMWCEAEAWVPKGEDPTTFLGTAFSISVVEHDERYTGDEAIVIAADALAYDAAARADAEEELRKLPARVYVTRYHQFAELPPPTVIVTLANTAIPILQGMVASGAYDILKQAVRKLILRTERVSDRCVLSVSMSEHIDVKVELPARPEDAPAVISEVFDGVAKMIQALPSESG